MQAFPTGILLTGFGHRNGRQPAGVGKVDSGVKTVRKHPPARLALSNMILMQCLHQVMAFKSCCCPSLATCMHVHVLKIKRLPKGLQYVQQSIQTSRSMYVLFQLRDSMVFHYFVMYHNFYIHDNSSTKFL